MPPSATSSAQTPAETRGKLRALRKMSMRIKEEIQENDRLEGKISVTAIRTRRLAYEAEERRRQLQKAQAAQKQRLQSREHDAQVRRDMEALLLEKQNSVHAEKKNARARLLKPSPQAAAAVSQFRRTGALVAAAKSKDFFGTIAVIESGKLGESILKDMKLHKMTCLEKRLEAEAEKSQEVAKTLTRYQLDPEPKRRGGIEKKLRNAERTLLSTHSACETLDPPHSPLLLRRPVSPGLHPSGNSKPFPAASPIRS